MICAIFSALGVRGLSAFCHDVAAAFVEDIPDGEGNVQIVVFALAERVDELNRPQSRRSTIRRQDQATHFRNAHASAEPRRSRARSRNRSHLVG